ncbi:MAG TPA: hypothetical protein DDW76_01555 [Cyanobacteria bacterium UBA11369]|nr:hypothetical protein [Cyanobacteria bacterium UBA11371]HBE30836.1 hypothetical protein [Cyanobacteria bacterium UBA11368]HBE47518.1 hypothetical protein [Cyanobacteria bacterium UBA11369]
MIPTQQTYREKLYPWSIIRHLPNVQRITVARFRRRNDALEHLQVLRRLIPNADLTVIFDARVTNTEVLTSTPLHNRG